MSRERLIAELRALYGAGTDNELMNNLQNCGLVSDESVTIDDASDGEEAA